MRSLTAMRLRRLTSGFDCHGTSNCSEKLCGRLWRAMCRMSRKPRVVIMPTSAPAALDHHVGGDGGAVEHGVDVARLRRRRCRRPSGCRRPRLRLVVRRAGHLGDDDLPLAAPPDRSRTMSVKVPPTSTPTRIMRSITGTATPTSRRCGHPTAPVRTVQPTLAPAPPRRFGKR